MTAVLEEPPRCAMCREPAVERVTRDGEEHFLCFRHAEAVRRLDRR